MKTEGENIGWDMAVDIVFPRESRKINKLKNGYVVNILKFVIFF